MKVPYFFALLLLPLLMSCDMDIYVRQTNQTVLFEYQRTNYAWGQYQRGWFIDNEGYVRTFNQPSQWFYPDQNKVISKTDMDANFLTADSICFQIDHQVLKSKIALIKKASEGKLSEPDWVMADFGAIFFNAYIYDTATANYQSVLLQQSGDVKIQNTSQEAKELYEWLMEINLQVYQASSTI